MNHKEIIKNYKRQTIIHNIFLSICIIWAGLIIAVSYALFDVKFNTWISGNGAWFIPFLISVEGIWFLLFLRFQKRDLKGLKRYLNEVDSSNRIRKKDYDKLSNDLEIAIENQSTFEKNCEEQIKLEKSNKIIETFKELEKK